MPSKFKYCYRFIIFLLIFIGGFCSAHLAIFSKNIDRFSFQTAKIFSTRQPAEEAPSPTTNVSTEKKLESLQSFNHIHVSEKLPGGFTPLCTPLADLKARRPPPAGKFWIYFIGNVGSICCRDLDCTSEAKLILEEGGHLEVCSDLKLGKYFGIAFVNTGYEKKMTESLMLIEDSKAKIRGIFRYASLKNIPDALEFVKHKKIIESEKK